jgi:hypothetical protein
MLRRSSWKGPGRRPAPSSLGPISPPDGRSGCPLVAAGTAALATSADTTPPSAPRIVYAQGYYCLTLIVGVNRSTDDQTPQSQLTYDVFADGRRIGSMADLGSTSGVWSIQHLTHTGPNTITVKAVDAAVTGPHPAPAPAPPTS